MPEKEFARERLVSLKRDIGYALCLGRGQDKDKKPAQDAEKSAADSAQV